MQFLHHAWNVFRQETIAIVKKRIQDIVELLGVDVTAFVLVLRYEILARIIPHLHSAKPHAKMSAGCPIALFALTLLFCRGSVTAVLASTHLEIKDARSLQPTGKIFHEDEVFLTCHVIRLRRR